MAIALYGATGYTGRLVTDELVRRGADFVLGGRSADRLARLADERGAGARYVAAAVDDAPALERLMDGCEVVINCAGPFTLAGETVVRAAVEAGCHYVDSTGEQPYMRAVFERHGAAAERRGVALVPALGFDYAPGDCAARLAAEGREPLEELEVAYAVGGFGATRGTARSAVEMMKGGDVVYANGGWRAPPRVPSAHSVEFPAPIGRRAVAKYPAGEIVTVPRHTRVRNVRAWIVADQFVPHPALAPAVPFLMPGLELLLRRPVRRLLGRAIDRLPEGPDERRRRAARFTVLATARGMDGEVGRVAVRGEDVYGLTAGILAHCAQAMAEPSYDRAGALGPAAAFGAEELLRALAPYGVTYERDPDVS